MLAPLGMQRHPHVSALAAAREVTHAGAAGHAATPSRQRPCGGELLPRPRVCYYTCAVRSCPTLPNTSTTMTLKPIMPSLRAHTFSKQLSSPGPGACPQAAAAAAASSLGPRAPKLILLPARLSFQLVHCLCCFNEVLPKCRRARGQVRGPARPPNQHSGASMTRRRRPPPPLFAASFRLTARLISHGNRPAPAPRELRLQPGEQRDLLTHHRRGCAQGGAGGRGLPLCSEGYGERGGAPWTGVQRAQG